MKIISFLIIIAGFNASYAAPPVINNHIKIDQFGYRINDKKIAVISNPITGYNSNDPFVPGNNYQLRRWNDDSVVYSANLTSWGSGTTQQQSGDKIWWFDFS